MFDEPVEHVIDSVFDWGESNLLPRKPSSSSSPSTASELSAKGKSLVASDDGSPTMTATNSSSSSQSLVLPLGLLGAGTFGEGLRRSWRAPASKTSTASVRASATPHIQTLLSGIRRSSGSRLMLGGGLAVLAASSYAAGARERAVQGTPLTFREE